MSITTSTSCKPSEEVVYPCLRVGISSGNLYLFTTKGECTQLSGKALGSVHTYLTPDNYEYYHGSITLSQE